jgi:UDP-N-acetylglucosamine--N-acetylmuramyl-(pentapeptide) pyrophosphoryl-undecaprenol N-acetylglucosamine transferase
MRIVFTGGGTGGHIFPIISIARELKRIRPDFSFYFIGPRDDFGSFMLSKEGIKVKSIVSGKIRRYWTFKSFFQNIFDIFKIIVGLIQSFFYLFFLFPDLIFSKGGYGSFPVSVLSYLFFTPVMLHESDVTPGLSNRIISKIALEIFSSFPVNETEFFPPEKVISVGNPVRKEIMKGSKEEAERIFDLKKGRPILLVLGGSQGSERINNLILNVLPQLLNDFQVIHQTGPKNFEEVRSESQVMINPSLNKYYHPHPFLEENKLKHALSACDMVLARAGSGTIFEIALCGKPSILVPLPESAQNHQVNNAYSYQEKGACLVIEERNLTANFFLERLKYITSSPEKMEKMSVSAKNFSRPRAAEIIAKYIMEYLIY